MFIGRERDLKDLEALWGRDHGVLVTCRGRRRIGKSTLIENILDSTGFVGRDSLDIELKELPPLQCQQMLGPAGERMSVREKIDLLSVVGGVPKYLEDVRPELSVDENVRRMCFMPRGILFREFDETFNGVFGRKARTRGRILRMLMSGPKSAAELAALDGKTPNGSYAKALKDLRIAGYVAGDGGLNQILTPLITLEAYIREKGYRSVYLIASERVRAHMAGRLADAGVSLEYDPEANELIALTYDKELTYDKLAKATGLWNMRNCPPSPMCPVRTQNQAPVDFVATHPDNCCPSERGPIPDIGGMMKFLEITNGMKPSHVFGKPSPTLLAPVLAKFKPEEIAVVGDRLYTDKAIADNAGVDFVCVLSGETTPEDLKNYRGTPPAIVVETFDKVQYAKDAEG